jgi:hypothetical protein
MNGGGGGCTCRGVSHVRGRRRTRRHGRRTYHNREWAAKMKRVGLDPSEIKTGAGEPTGRTTGQTVTRRITGTAAPSTWRGGR